MTDRKNWFTDQQTKGEMNSLAIGIIEEIMGDISTSARHKVILIAETLDGLMRAWDIKKPSIAMGGIEKTNYPNYSIDLEKKDSRKWTVKEIMRQEG